MAGTFTFHNKFHRANHYSISGLQIIDAGLDPIASKEYPFIGVFYNTLTDLDRTFEIYTNSLEWWSSTTTFRTYSGNWMLTRSLYTTVSSLSDQWSSGFDAYGTINQLSGQYVSLYSTVCSLSAEWGSPYLMFTNRSQVYTHSKTFSGQDLRSISTSGPFLSVFNWDLNSQQIAFLNVRRRIFIRTPIAETMINGGHYTLVLKQDNVTNPNVGWDVEFDTAYRFNDKNTNTNVVNKALSGITKIDFICINGLMYGDVTYLSGNF
jgi:hypothetical protein